MGKVEAFALEGIHCWFWSNDHRPPHFNAKRRPRWCYRVRFMLPRDQMLLPEKGSPGRMSARDRKRLCDLAEAHREELLREWERKVKCDD
jgi:hypothetical protein